MLHPKHILKRLKYISLINVKMIRLIYENKIDRAKHLYDFKHILKKQLDETDQKKW